MSPIKLLFAPLFSAALLVFSQAAFGQQMTATITKDEANEFSCSAKKRVAVLVNASRELLPEERYQYALGGGMHVVCADYSGNPLQTGRKVKVSLSDSRVQILQ